MVDAECRALEQPEEALGHADVNPRATFAAGVPSRSRTGLGRAAGVPSRSRRSRSPGPAAASRRPKAWRAAGAAGAVLDAEALAQAERQDRLGRVQHQEHREVPVPQRQAGAFHRRADREGELLAAAIAALEAVAPTRNPRDPLQPAACRAHRPLGPAHASKVPAAGVPRSRIDRGSRRASCPAA